MSPMRGVALAALVMALAAGADANEPGHGAKKMTAEEIVAKNVAARGGLDAWRKLETVVWVGHMESADPNVPSLRFVLEQKRPNMTRFEVAAPTQKTLRVFDGAHGWKLRPDRTGGVTAEPYSPQDLEFAKQAQGIDGPLIDYQAKGNSVALAGMETIEGRGTYRLHVKLVSGEVHDVWIDAKTFLDVKYDRTSYTASGAHGTVSVFYRDYKSIEGLQIPGVLEIGGGSGKVADRLVIENIALNPPLEDKLFTRPDNAHRRRMATVDIEAPPVDPRRNAFETPPVGSPSK
jgi:outer membrane lipoprotein-sorting protein